MRTTFTASPDVADQLKIIAERTHRSMSKVVNDLLREAMFGSKPLQVRERYSVQTRNLGLRPGFDPERLSALLADMEVGDIDRSGH